MLVECLWRARVYGVRVIVVRALCARVCGVIVVCSCLWCECARAWCVCVCVCVRVFVVFL